MPGDGAGRDAGRALASGAGAGLRRTLGALLAEGLDAAGLALAACAGDALLDYVELLGRWNRAYNLTAVRRPEDVVRRHLLDCLVVLPYVRGTRILDLGSGAGLPGLVLALAAPERHWVLLDANAKKTRFCRQAAARLAADGVEVVQARAESYRPAVRFDTVMARALGPVARLAALAEPLCAKGGVILAMKGRRPDAEVAALPAALRSRTRVRPLRVPGLAEPRHLVVIEPGAPVPASGSADPRETPPA